MSLIWKVVNISPQSESGDEIEAVITERAEWDGIKIEREFNATLNVVRLGKRYLSLLDKNDHWVTIQSSTSEEEIKIIAERLIK